MYQNNPSDQAAAQAILDLVQEQTVLSNHASVRVETVLLASILDSLRDCHSRLSAIEINTLIQETLNHEPLPSSRTAEPSPAKPRTEGTKPL
jgi:hypothetical protein